MDDPTGCGVCHDTGCDLCDPAPTPSNAKDDAVEAVARAIFGDEELWPELSEGTRHLHRHKARAAIQAMRAAQ